MTVYASSGVDAMASRASADAWGQRWSLQAGGQEFVGMPRAAALRLMGISHPIHHRGQLTVYLRLLGIPLPSVYGPTADEPFGG